MSKDASSSAGGFLSKDASSALSNTKNCSRFGYEITANWPAKKCPPHRIPDSFPIGSDDLATRTRTDALPIVGATLVVRESL